MKKAAWMVFFSLMHVSTGISDVAFGSGPHVVAMTTDGKLYSWGHDGYGQLGLGIFMTTSQGTVPRLIRGDLERLKVTQVACGGHHTLVLTVTQEVKGHHKDLVTLFYFCLRFLPGATITVGRLGAVTH